MLDVNFVHNSQEQDGIIDMKNPTDVDLGLITEGDENVGFVS